MRSRRSCLQGTCAHSGGSRRRGRHEIRSHRSSRLWTDLCGPIEVDARRKARDVAGQACTAVLRCSHHMELTKATTGHLPRRRAQPQRSPPALSGSPPVRLQPRQHQMRCPNRQFAAIRSQLIASIAFVQAMLFHQLLLYLLPLTVDSLSTMRQRSMLMVTKLNFRVLPHRRRPGGGRQCFAHDLPEVFRRCGSVVNVQQP